MRIHIFCVRDLRDYLDAMTDMSEFNALPDFDPQFAPFADAPDIQKFLFDMMKFYKNRDEALSAPVVGETGIDGLRLDFNFGLRLDVPEGNFRVKIGEVGGQTFFDREISAVRIVSFEKFFVRWRVEVFSGGEKIFEHDLDFDGQSVLIAPTSSALGDTLAMLPAVEELRRRNRCRVSVRLPEYLREFVAHVYPEIVLDDTGEYYATFYPNWFCGNIPINPIDPRFGNIAKVLGANFGIDWFAPKPTFKPTAPPVTNSPYVCIGVQASVNRKAWLYPNGWDIVVDYLQRLGYRVFCIDKDSSQTSDSVTIGKPSNAEDFTGDFSIMHRANMLYHAEFFIGLSSGLAWLADAVNCPVVMICGFSYDWFEFDTPWRVTNRRVCGGCLNDERMSEFLYGARCPRFGGTVREFECQKKISPQQVIDAIERLIVDRHLTVPILS